MRPSFQSSLGLELPHFGLHEPLDDFQMHLQGNGSFSRKSPQLVGVASQLGPVAGSQKPEQWIWAFWLLTFEFLVARVASACVDGLVAGFHGL